MELKEGAKRKSTTANMYILYFPRTTLTITLSPSFHSVNIWLALQTGELYSHLKWLTLSNRRFRGSSLFLQLATAVYAMLLCGNRLLKMISMTYYVCLQLVSCIWRAYSELQRLQDFSSVKYLSVFCDTEHILGFGKCHSS